jgi:hypothetical protein
MKNGLSAMVQYWCNLSAILHRAQVLGAMVQCAYMYALARCTTALTNRKPINQNHAIRYLFHTGTCRSDRSFHR